MSATPENIKAAGQPLVTAFTEKKRKHRRKKRPNTHDNQVKSKSSTSSQTTSKVDILDIQDEQGNTPLHIACNKYSSKYDSDNLLLEFIEGYTGNISLKDNYGYTPLHIASNRNLENIVKILLEKGADITITDNTGRTPLHIAIIKEHYNLIQLLEPIKIVPQAIEDSVAASSSEKTTAVKLN